MLRRLTLVEGGPQPQSAVTFEPRTNRVCECVRWAGPGSTHTRKTFGTHMNMTDNEFVQLYDFHFYVRDFVFNDILMTLHLSTNLAGFEIYHDTKYAVSIIMT